MLHPWSWSEHTLRVLTALGTAGAVVALVLVETMKGSWRALRARTTRPMLTLSHDPKVDIGREVGPHPQQPPTAGHVQVAYVRIAVENTAGRRAAEGVEVVVKRVDLTGGGGEGDEKRFPAHNMGPLGWTHREPLESRLGPSDSRTVVLGLMFVGDNRFYVGLGIPEPNSRINILAPGSYDFTLRMSAANVDAADWKVTLWFGGDLTLERDFTEQVKITAGPDPA